MVKKLTNYDLSRYARQILIPGWGKTGQKKLRNSSVFIAGAGGLGSSVAFYLAAAGVGEIRICDFDKVELSNLNRQILHTDDTVLEFKTLSAQTTLNKFNPSIKIIPITDHITKNNVQDLAGNAQMIVDCLDNYETRYILSKYCLKSSLPFIHGAIRGMVGQVSFFQPPDTPCLRCIIPQAMHSEIFPVVGVTPGLVGSIQALEVLKFVTGVGLLLKGKFLFIDGEIMRFKTITIKRDPSCPDCSELHPNSVKEKG